MNWSLVHLGYLVLVGVVTASVIAQGWRALVRWRTRLTERAGEVARWRQRRR